MRRCIQCMTPLKEIIHVYNIFKPPTPFCERCEQLWNNIRITHLDERCSRCLNIKLLIQMTVWIVNSWKGIQIDGSIVLSISLPRSNERRVTAI